MFSILPAMIIPLQKKNNHIKIEHFSFGDNMRDGITQCVAVGNPCQQRATSSQCFLCFEVIFAWRAVTFHCS